MKNLLAPALAFFCSSVIALGYGKEGHVIVGRIADQVLAGTPAEVHVRELLGGNLTLADVATWADKIKDGKMGDKGLDEFLDAHLEKVGRKVEHKMFHYTEIPFQADRYFSTSAGANERDIVHAMTDCILILEDKSPVHPWFQKVDKRTALILLAHYVGDIHQPLHVGAGYINGTLFVDPNNTALPYHGDEQGNKLLFNSEPLHSFWDKQTVLKAMADAEKDQGIPFTPESFSVYLFKKNSPIEVSAGDASEWPERWASDILPIALKAHQIKITGEITFKGKTGIEESGWSIQLPDHYEEWASRVVQDELVKGGYRLAQICEQIWPKP